MKKKLLFFGALSAFLTVMIAANFPAVIPNNILSFGKTGAGNKTVEFNLSKAGAATNPKLRWNNTTSKLEITLDGTNYKTLNLGTDIDSTGGLSGQVLTANGSGISAWITPAGVPTGISTEFWGTTAPTGWVMMNGNTIGDASSGATGRANADTQALFVLLWDAISNTNLPIQDSAGAASTRGASALADFAAHKRLPVPDHRNIFARGVNASTRTIGSVTYPVVNLAEVINDMTQGHKHNDSGHTHTYQYSNSYANNTTGNFFSMNRDSLSTSSAGIYTGYANIGGPVDNGQGTPRIGNETTPVYIGANYIIKL